MCDKKGRCREADAAKRHVGEWTLNIGSGEAGDVQYVMDEAAAAGVTLATVGDVLAFCLETVVGTMAARAAFAPTGLTGERGHK